MNDKEYSVLEEIRNTFANVNTKTNGDNMHSQDDNISSNSIHESQDYKCEYEDGRLTTPNDKEIKNYARMLLLGVYNRQEWVLFGNSIPVNMTKQTYLTMKGQIRHGHIDAVDEYFRKRGVSNFSNMVDKYASSKCIFRCATNITFKQPVKLFTVDIDLENNKEER